MLSCTAPSFGHRTFWSLGPRRPVGGCLSQYCLCAALAIGHHLCCVFSSLSGPLCSRGMCQSTYRYSQAGKLPPWTLFWKMPFSLLTVDFVRGNESLLMRSSSLPWSEGDQNGPFSFAVSTLFSLCIHPSLFFLFLFFLLLGAFRLYLLILFVAKPAEGGAPLCDLLITLHLPPLLYPPPPRERERERGVPTFPLP